MKTGVKGGNEAFGRRAGSIARLLGIFAVRDKPSPECDFALQGRNEKEQLIEELNYAKSEWQTAQREFNSVNEKEIIDSCVYKMLSCRIRYEFLIKKAREMGISLDIKLSG